jgi:glyoxylase-like metal-dependent hydrolase (beta-lactamase superfamily II)
MTRALPVVTPWFSATRVDAATLLLSEPHVDPFLRANLWLVRGSERDLVVDTGNGIVPLRPFVVALQDDPGKPLVAVATHVHCDHAGGLHEFDERLVHEAEIYLLSHLADSPPLLASSWPRVFVEECAATGYPLPEVLLEARPHGDFDPSAFAPTPCRATGALHDGDVIDLGDRTFEVLSLPGHSPGGIGLWETETGTLFSGDTVYEDGELLDSLPGGDRETYRRTVRRLRGLPVNVVHAGHEPSFERERLIEICDNYLHLTGG